ncbi:uncharacterized protein (DUF4213/DUF364 family) [Luteibacter sp. 1214]|uniref:hypothetical protein n=1 Tax=Luteibacter sp. 1214 TaxID=2817735 RepID=UPI00285F76E2|nr:hypothetical protein [Luteibacter sp. 1214]MDR6642911.1 uncharacterized protein (DUF4213/DUF364 family) [Luteibacter sp. 1214]
MSVSKEHQTEGPLCYHADPEATAHALLNEATEWLQFARGLTGLLADLIHEADSVDCRRMALGLEAIGALTNMGVQCAAQAHVRMCWEQARCADVAPPGASGQE